MTAAVCRSETVEVFDYQVPVQIGGDGPPLLLLHGAGGAGAWLEFHERLATAFTVYAPAHPGFAGTPLPGWVRGVDDLAFHYVDLIRALGLAQPAVVGHSLGGWIATELAVTRPDLLGPLVLLSALGVRPEQPMPDLFIMEPAEAMSLLFADPSKAMALMPGEFGIDAIVRMYEEQGAVARLMWKRPYSQKLRRRLHHIASPTLVLWGDGDQLLPPSHGERLAAEIAGARFQQIAGAGHAVQIDAPAETAEAIIAFARNGT